MLGWQVQTGVTPNSMLMCGSYSMAIRHGSDAIQVPSRMIFVTIPYNTDAK